MLLTQRSILIVNKTPTAVSRIQPVTNAPHIEPRMFTLCSHPTRRPNAADHAEQSFVNMDS